MRISTSLTWSASPPRSRTTPRCELCPRRPCKHTWAAKALNVARGHRRHARCVALGLPAFLEKPPSLDYNEYLQMVATEARRRDDAAETFVGFNFIVEPVCAPT